MDIIRIPIMQFGGIEFVISGVCDERQAQFVTTQKTHGTLTAEIQRQIEDLVRAYVPGREINISYPSLARVN